VRIRGGTAALLALALAAGCGDERPPIAMGAPALLEPKLAYELTHSDADRAFALLAAANRQDPDDAFLYTLAARAQLRTSNGLLRQAGRQALDFLTSLRVRDARRRYARLDTALPGRSEIAYVSASDSPLGSLFVDMLRVLGKGTPAALALGAAPEASQRVVLGPGVRGLGALPVNRLVALAPQPELEAALGLRDGKVRAMERCVFTSSDATLPLVQGMALPIEGSFTAYAAQAPSLATLRCADGEHPALFRLERPGGEPAFMFAFDVLASLVRTRQGDPALARQESDGVVGLRPSDLFARDLGAAELQVPFSDRLMQALLELVEGERPTLRFWQNPPGTRGVLIVTSDQDFAQDFQLAIVAAALVRWQVPATFYLTSGTYQANGQEALTAPAPELAAQLHALGIDLGAHTYLMAKADKTEAEMVRSHAQALERAYGEIPLSSRYHIVIWRGYDEPARNLAAAGYRYDTSYLTLHSQHLSGLGYMTGGGLPLHFRAADGSELSVRQLPTQLDDHVHPIYETGLVDSRGKSLTMSYAQLIALSRGLLEASGRHYHSPIVVNNHPFQFADDPSWLHTLVDTARAEQLALLGVEGYDAFVSALSDSLIQESAAEYHVLVRADSQDVLVRNYAGDALHVDGQPVTLRKLRLFDRDEKVLRLARGAHTVLLR
jgi:hypothetical protein